MHSVVQANPFKCAERMIITRGFIPLSRKRFVPVVSWSWKVFSFGLLKRSSWKGGAERTRSASSSLALLTRFSHSRLGWNFFRVLMGLILKESVFSPIWKRPLRFGHAAWWRLPKFCISVWNFRRIRNTDADGWEVRMQTKPRGSCLQGGVSHMEIWSIDSEMRLRDAPTASNPGNLQIYAADTSNERWINSSRQIW